MQFNKKSNLKIVHSKNVTLPIKESLLLQMQKELQYIEVILKQLDGNGKENDRSL